MTKANASVEKFYATWNLKSATIGGGLWLAIVLLTGTKQLAISLHEQLFLLAPLVIVPLALRLIGPCASLDKVFYDLALLFQPFAAIAVVISLLLPPGILAAVLAASWLGVTSLLAVVGVVRLWLRAWPDLYEMTICAGLLYIPVGAVWLITSRLAINPLGFTDIIVFLTAVHFHYAGFTTCILVGVIGKRFFANDNSYSLYRWAVLGVVSGTPLVAIGITFASRFHGLELVVAHIMAFSLLLFALIVIVKVIPQVVSRRAKFLLVIANCSLLLSMSLVSIYALGLFSNKVLFSIYIPQMIQYHGTVNALGFAFCGIVACNLICQETV